MHTLNPEARYTATRVASANPNGPKRGRSRSTDRVQSVAFAFVWILAFAIPWGDMVLLPGQVQASRAFTLVAAAMTLASLWRGHQVRPLRGPLLWMLAFAFWSVSSMLWTPEPATTARRILSNFQLMLDSWLIYQSAQTTGRYQKLLLAYVAGCYVAFGGMLYNFLNDVRQGDGRLTAPGFDPNDLAVTLVLGIPLAWHLTFHSKVLKWLVRAYIPCAILAGLLTASRGALLTLAVCMIYPLLSITRSSLRAIAGTLFLLAVSAGAVLLLWDQISVSRLATISDQLTSRDLNGRVIIWSRGVDPFLENPLTGVGAGAFGSAAGAGRSRELAAHNSMVSVLVEYGMIGGTLFAGIIYSLFAAARKAPRNESHLWLVILLAWCVAVTALSWENRELTWLIWGLCAAQPWLRNRHSLCFFRGGIHVQA